MRKVILDLILADTLEVKYWDLDKNGDLNPEDDDGYLALLQIAKHEGIDPADQTEQAESSNESAPEQPAPRAKIQLKLKTKDAAAAETVDAGPVVKIKKHRAPIVVPEAEWPFPGTKSDSKGPGESSA